MARVVLVCALVGAFVLVPLQAQAGRRTPTVSDCFHLEIRPERIMFACADGGYYVTHLKWQRWHIFRATGQGLFRQNDCRPSCAGGTFHARRGRITLLRRVWCPMPTSTSSAARGSSTNVLSSAKNERAFACSVLCSAPAIGSTRWPIHRQSIRTPASLRLIGMPWTSDTRRT